MSSNSNSNASVNEYFETEPVVKDPIAEVHEAWAVMAEKAAVLLEEWESLENEKEEMAEKRKRVLAQSLDIRTEIEKKKRDAKLVEERLDKARK